MAKWGYFRMLLAATSDVVILLESHRRWECVHAFREAPGSLSWLYRGTSVGEAGVVVMLRKSSVATAWDTHDAEVSADLLHCSALLLGRVAELDVRLPSASPVCISIPPSRPLPSEALSAFCTIADSRQRRGRP